jgi:hypothetical protein
VSYFLGGLVEVGEMIGGTPTLILPKRRAREAATRVESAAMMLVVKKMEPSEPSERSNFSLKNTVSHGLKSC